MKIIEKINFVQVFEGELSATTGTQTKVTYFATKAPEFVVMMSEPSEATTDDTAVRKNFCVCPASITFTESKQSGHFKIKGQHPSQIARVYAFF